MTRINIQVELENPDYCNGCPCIKGSKDFESWIYCGVYGIGLEHHVQTFPEIKHTGHFNRPDICKEQNKEVHNG